jgi:hypothetical protein
MHTLRKVPYPLLNNGAAESACLRFFMMRLCGYARAAISYVQKEPDLPTYKSNYQVRMAGGTNHTRQFSNQWQLKPHDVMQRMVTSIG